jgi:hypothetical protein
MCGWVGAEPMLSMLAEPHRLSGGHVLRLLAAALT